jgi:hypothetical protein
MDELAKENLTLNDQLKTISSKHDKKVRLSSSFTLTLSLSQMNEIFIFMLICLFLRLQNLDKTSSLHSKEDEALIKKQNTKITELESEVKSLT